MESWQSRFFDGNYLKTPLYSSRLMHLQDVTVVHGASECPFLAVDLPGSMSRHSDIIAWIACLPPDPQCQPLSLQHRLDPHYSAHSGQHRKILCHVSLKDCITQSTITLVFHGPCQFPASNLSTALQSRPHPPFILSVAFSSILHLLFDELPQLMQNKIEKRSRNSSPIAFPWS